MLHCRMANPKAVLVLGGSVFLGRAVVLEAQALGAEVTVFNRGVSGTQPPGVTHVRGDRTVATDLEQLRGRSFDVVVDTCGYVPADVARSAGMLAGTCGHYAFVSSVSVFPGWPEAADYHRDGPWDGDPDATRDDVPGDFDGAQSYGWLKAGCELAVRRALGDDRSAVLRAGCIVGPADSAVARLPWWIARVARGGHVLAPGRPSDPLALIDSRDLARFALSGAAGVFECGGPSGRDTFGDLLAACAAATGSDARLVWADAGWLARQGVDGWTELPLWLPPVQAPSLWAHDNRPAQAAGLAWRPLAATVGDTWSWLRDLPAPWTPSERTPGLDPAREQALLDRWSMTSL
jgi:nucleoside-diphosphate-sugar epimerase